MSTNQSKRPIRSYVLREGRMTPAQSQAIEQLWPIYGLTLDKGIFDYESIFKRSAEVVVEIGFGNGSSLLAQAQAHPEQNFIGIEVHRPGVGALLKAVETAGLTNIRIIRADAVSVLNQCIRDNSLSKIQVFFPDPWPKKKHHKRRLINPAFITLACKKLQSGGLLHLATDWQHYAEQMMALLSAQPELVNTAGLKQFCAHTGDRSNTKFEIRGRHLGHDVWDLIFAKDVEFKS